MPGAVGKEGVVLPTGRICYGKDKNGHFYPIELIANAAEAVGQTRVAMSEPFIFRPGATTLANGMVESGTRSASGTTTSGTVASSTYWGGWKTFSPYRTGKIDGLASGGILSGQLTIGVKCSAGTGVASLTARIANTANTSAPTTMLALATTVTCTTAEIYKTYDIPYLQCDTVMNSVPFSVAIGAQHSQGGSSVVFRIMESSYIEGSFEPGT